MNAKQKEKTISIWYNKTFAKRSSLRNDCDGCNERMQKTIAMSTQQKQEHIGAKDLQTL